MILMDRNGAWLVCFRRPHLLFVTFDTICQQRPLPSPILPNFTPSTIQPYFTHPVFACGRLPLSTAFPFPLPRPRLITPFTTHPTHYVVKVRLAQWQLKSSFNLRPSLFAEFATDYARRWIASRVGG